MSSPQDPSVRLKAALKSGKYASNVSNNVQLRRAIHEWKAASEDHVRRVRALDALTSLGLLTASEEHLRTAFNRGRCDGRHMPDALCRDCSAERAKERERAEAGAA